jgi:hypothetical protein
LAASVKSETILDPQTRARRCGPQLFIFHFSFFISLAVAAIAWSQATGNVQAWRTADGAVLWRGGERGGLAWELFDADGDGRPEVAVFFAGPRYTRVEIDTNGDHVADRVHLFEPDGTVTSYLDENGDGVLETPPGTPSERQRAIREIGRGGELFERALQARFDADAGLLTAVNVPAPPIAPPMKRPGGPPVTVRLRLSLIPGAPAIMLQRQDDLAHLGEFTIAAPTAVGVIEQHFALHIRTDPTATRADENGELDLGVYPVFVREPTADGTIVQTLVLQITGRLRRADLSPETFFVSARLREAGPVFAEAPVRDLAGRPAGQLAIEIVRPAQ